MSAGNHGGQGRAPGSLIGRIRQVAVVLGVLATTSCSLWEELAADPRAPDAAHPRTLTAAQAEISRQQERIQALEAELAQGREALAAANLSRLELQTRLAQLEQRHQALERSRDEAVAEVVRAQARLRGSVSQADAASSIAEAEIALAGSTALPASERQALQTLLAQAEAEYEQGNPGGALYLSQQTRRRLSDARSDPAPDLAPIDGEVPFGVPLSLATTARSNVRAGPGLEHAVVEVVPAGTQLLAHSYKELWVRVTLAGGTEGWVYKPLLAGE